MTEGTDRKAEGLMRGVVIAKNEIRGLYGRTIYAFRLRCEDDGACEDDIEVREDLYRSVTIEGFGDDTTIEYGTIHPRRVT